MKKEKRERNTPRPIRVGAVEIARTGVVGVTETDTVGTAETGAKNIAEMGAIGAAGEVVVSISVSATTPSPSKVSAIRGIDMQDKGRPH